MQLQVLPEAIPNHLLTCLGPLPSRPTLQLRHPKDRRTFRLQVLPGRRGPGAGAQPQGHVPQGAAREAGELAERVQGGVLRRHSETGEV